MAKLIKNGWRKTKIHELIKNFLCLDLNLQYAIDVDNNLSQVLGNPMEVTIVLDLIFDGILCPIHIKCDTDIIFHYCDR